MVRSMEGRHADYFEAILQLRNITSEVVDFVHEEFQKRSIPVSKEKEVTNGFDFYLADNDATKSLGKKLQQKFGGELNITAKLHTQKKDKELYRVTVLFRQAGFQKGDIVEYKGEKYHVKAMGGKDILLQNSKTGKKEHVKWKEMEKIKR